MQQRASPPPPPNAVNDTLKGLGVELPVSPVTPRRGMEAIAAAHGAMNKRSTT